MKSPQPNMNEDQNDSSTKDDVQDSNEDDNVNSEPLTTIEIKPDVDSREDMYSNDKDSESNNPEDKEEQDNSDFSNHNGMKEQGNVIILGSVAPVKEVEASSTQVKKKRRKPNELENLGITEFKEEDEKYDVYADNDRVYKKYRLREGMDKPNYKIPTFDLFNLSYQPSNDANVQCPRCRKKISNRVELRRHIRSEHKMTYTCSLCYQYFDTNADLIAHKAIHDGENRSFLCHECKVAFSDHCDFLLHEIVHRKPSSLFTCPECSLSYHKTGYEIHLLTHFSRPVTCPICSKKIKGEHNLRSHINQHSVKLECVECGKILKNKKEYDRHMDLHTGVKSYQCLYCGKGFNTSGQRNVHTRIHTNERPFSCKICDKRFKQSTDMQRHLATHDKEKKYPCEVCNKRFMHKADLAFHRRVHSGKNLYDCPECEKRFTTMCGLRTHVLYIHTKERPYQCKACNYSSVTSTHYNRHIKTKAHKRNTYKETMSKKE